MALRTVLVMCCWNTVVLSVLVQASWCLDDLTFPPGFKFGAATSAYQIEGAWNVSGFTFKVATSAYQVEGVWNFSDKGESNWDRMTHDHPDLIAGGSNGDVACDSYVQWRRDVQMAADLGLHHYRFSISWSRLLPTGYTNHVSKEGAAYYNNLIDELLRNGIEPMVTIFHFDLPHNLQVLGGWTNPLSVDWFADYSRVAFSLYADRVKTWLTINEPIIICDYTYNEGKIPPLLVETELAPYLCNKNVLIAHARAWRIYDEEFKQKFHGQVSIVNHLVWYQPVNPTDSKLAELALQHSAGRYSHPIYSKEGGWPPATEELMAVISKAQGFNKSRLPSFTKEEKQLVYSRNLTYSLILLYDLKFPPGFTFKVATSAYQVEGVWNISDKGESNWDRMTHDHPDLIAGGSNGDVACDSYVQWRRDVQMAADLGLHHYRFSISWSRLLPTGYTNHVSKEGAAYYNNLIDELLRNGIEPMVTIFHFDLPHNLQVLGQVSIVNHLVWYQPVNPTDSKLAELALQHSAGRYSHPIYSKEGGWPPATEELMAVISKAQGFNKSRLPSFTKEEKQLVRGTYDFYAMNYYTSREVRPAGPEETVGPWFFTGWPDMDAVLVQPKESGVGASKILSVYPPGIRHQLAWLKKEYGDISILITENGYSDFGESLVDEDRIDFIEKHLKQILLSIKEDEVNVTGYTLWSLLDNFEWTEGYSSKFGLYEVDLDDPARPRRPRKSAYYYANVIKKNSLNISEDYYALRGNSVILN